MNQRDSDLAWQPSDAGDDVLHAPVAEGALRDKCAREISRSARNLQALPVRWIGVLESFKMARFINRYVEYRRVGLRRVPAARLAWIVAWAGAIVVNTRHPSL